VYGSRGILSRFHFFFSLPEGFYLSSFFAAWPTDNLVFFPFLFPAFFYHVFFYRSSMISPPRLPIPRIYSVCSLILHCSPLDVDQSPVFFFEPMLLHLFFCSPLLVINKESIYRGFFFSIHFSSSLVSF